MAQQLLIRIHEWRDGECIKFTCVRRGKKVEGFLSRIDGTWVAYQNLCRHMPLSIDYDDGKFFTGDGKHIICQTHAALYDPKTGLCVRGPCEGLSLIPLPIEVRDGAVWLTGEKESEAKKTTRPESDV